MKISYDEEVDAIYIELALGKYSESRKISDVILVDEDAKGKILGIEILEATRNIKDFNPPELTFSNIPLVRDKHNSKS